MYITWTRTRRTYAESNLMTLCHSCHKSWDETHGSASLKRGAPCRICGKPSKKLGLCSKHYQRQRKYGDARLTKRGNGSGVYLVREEHRRVTVSPVVATVTNGCENLDAPRLREQHSAGGGGPVHRDRRHGDGGGKGKAMIYVATSWRNWRQPKVVELLKREGHEVYDFHHPKPGNDGFHWSDIDAGWRRLDVQAVPQGS